MAAVISGPIAAQQPADMPGVVAYDGTALAANKKRILANDPDLMPAYRELIKNAGKALAFGPVSVMEKKNIPPSGDKHDYMSLAPYHWPDPAQPDRPPYIPKDGNTKQERKSKR